MVSHSRTSKPNSINEQRKSVDAKAMQNRNGQTRKGMLLKLKQSKKQGKWEMLQPQKHSLLRLRKQELKCECTIQNYYLQQRERHYSPVQFRKPIKSCQS